MKFDLAVQPRLKEIRIIFGGTPFVCFSRTLIDAASTFMELGFLKRTILAQGRPFQLGRSQW